MNTAITKWRTGKSGFTGYKDFNETEPGEIKTKNLKTKKLLATAGMTAMMLASIGAFSKGKKGLFSKGGLKRFGEKLELKDKFAHMDVVKLVYASILSGRFMAARDNNELKVSIARDYTGFLNWLVLGCVVAKGAAYLSDKSKSLTNIDGPIKAQNPLKTAKNFLENVSMKTVSERKFLTKNLSESQKTLTAAKHNGSKLIGLAYAMIALGIAVPLLINKYIINDPRKNKKDEKEGNVYGLSLNKSNQPLSFSKLNATNNDLYGGFVTRMQKYA
jgi:hypothetical protein